MPIFTQTLALIKTIRFLIKLIFNIMRLALLIISLSVLQNLSAQNSMDTIIISDKLLDVGIYFPTRPCFFENTIGTTFNDGNQKDRASYIDSIQVGTQIINKYNQKYFLILKDSKGTKILEGEFFDEFPNGHVITYYANGKKKFEGDYKIETYKKSKTICKFGGIKLLKSRYSVQVGEWKYYSSSGALIETKVQKN